MKRLPAIAFSVLAGFSLASILGVNHGPAQAGPSTSNGDMNGDGDLDIADVLYTLMHLFKGGPAPVACAGSPDLEARVAALEQEIAASREVLSYISLRDEPIGDYDVCCQVPEDEYNPCLDGHRDPTLGKTLRFDGVNVQIVNGTGSTYELNGLGNLVVGYQEPRAWCSERHEPCDDENVNLRGGSHNLVVGSRHNYRGAASAAIGRGHTIWAGHTCAIGGSGNKAIAKNTVVVGGSGNVAGAPSSAVIGGRDNLIGDNDAVIVGGFNQTVGDIQRCQGP